MPPKKINAIEQEISQLELRLSELNDILKETYIQKEATEKLLLERNEDLKKLRLKQEAKMRAEIEAKLEEERKQKELENKIRAEMETKLRIEAEFIAKEKDKRMA